MVTIKDVAKVAGVSPSTVSRVVRKEGKVGKKCRAKVQKVIDDMGYRPNTHARALVSKHSELVGVITPVLHKPFFGSIAHGAERAASAQDYRVMTLNSLNDTDDELSAINSLQEHGCQNIILHSKYGNDEELRILADKIPGLVFINRLILGVPTRCVWLDNVLGGKLVADYLYDKGHRDIAIVSFNSKNRDQHERIEGIKQALTVKGERIPEKNIYFPADNLLGKLGMETYCEQAVNALYERGANFSAIIAYNDEMAIGVMNALFNRGKVVPDDVSIIGFDDLDIAKICRPKLTTVNYPIVEMAEYATKLSLRLTDKNIDSQDKTHLFMPTLVERDSVRTIPR